MLFRELAKTTTETADPVQRNDGASRAASPFVQLQQHQSVASNSGRTSRQPPITEPSEAGGCGLGGARAHDPADGGAAVGGLRLDEAGRTIGPEAGAVAGHAELELARAARSEIAAVRGRRNEEDVRAQLFDDGTHGMAPELGVVVGEPLVLDHDDAFGAVSCRLACRAGDVGAENERHVLAAELPGELASLADQLERGADRATADVLDQRP